MVSSGVIGRIRDTDKRAEAILWQIIEIGKPCRGYGPIGPFLKIGTGKRQRIGTSIARRHSRDRCLGRRLYNLI